MRYKGCVVVAGEDDGELCCVESALSSTLCITSL
jgi:hypothetical protein